MGFGFVEYRKPEQAQKALKQLQVRWGFRLRSLEALGGAWGGGCLSALLNLNRNAD